RSASARALGVMRGPRDALMEGRLPSDRPDVQAPAGGHLGNWSPMHFQALLYLPLSRLIPNDLVCYNLIWAGNLLFTGVGTFVLAWQLLRSPGGALYARPSAMLAAPPFPHPTG